MAFDWDAEVLGPAMAIFAEGDANAPSSWPTYRPRRGAAFQLENAVFTAAYRRITDLADGSTDATYRPVLGVRDAVFAVPGRAQPAQGDTVFIPSAGKLYAVTNPEPDGIGHTLLILIEAE